MSSAVRPSMPQRFAALAAVTALVLAGLVGLAAAPASAVSVAAPPSNDNIANATLLDLSGIATTPVTSTVERVDATTETDESRLGCGNLQTVWWVIKPSTR